MTANTTLRMMLTAAILLFSCSLSSGPAWAQRSFGGGRPGGLGGAAGVGGTTFGRGPAASPLFNPPGSLSLNSRVNPPGSLSAAERFHPPGSVFSPGSGSARGGGGSWHVGYRGGQLAAPSAEDLGIMPRASVVSWSHSGVQLLARQLSRFGNGRDWKKHLQVDSLQTLLDETSDEALEASRSARLTEVLAIYDSVAEQTSLEPVSRLSGFGIVRSSLRELVETPGNDHRQRLVRSADRLGRELAAIRTGDSWKRYLSLPAGVSAGEPSDVTLTDQESAYIDDLKKLQGRFQLTQENPEYRKITRLPAFAVTFENLTGYLGSLTE